MPTCWLWFNRVYSRLHGKKKGSDLLNLSFIMRVAIQDYITVQVMYVNTHTRNANALFFLSFLYIHIQLSGGIQ